MKIETPDNFKHKMIEIKARVNDHELLRKKLSALGAEYKGTFQQSDLYFKVPEGRLKLREVEANSTVELIYYNREDIAGPKTDDAFILRIQEPGELKKILKKILKPLIVIDKVREIYLHCGIQIHLDSVEKLGKFIEFEKQTTDTPESIVRSRLSLQKLMEKLEIDPSNLESHSYSDLLQV
ncbi:MAG: class IV adenylate cyclase [Candidatus Bathyarchaeota archaeon]|nr:class IV adenylate cyclase [Candidatus Bathyarchaeum sp.]